MAFQNSHFALAYDRPCITMVSHPEIPFDQKSMPGHRTYFETLCRVIQLSLEILRGRATSTHPHGHFHEIREYQQRTQRIIVEGMPHLRDLEKCTTTTQHIENAELQLHSSYVMSVLCRVALDASAPRHFDQEQWAVVKEECIENLISTVDAYVALHSIDRRYSRAWISLQRAIACAFLLVSNERGQTDPRTWDLIEKLEKVLSDHVSGSSASGKKGITLTANHLTSSIQALRKVSSVASLVKSRSRASKEEMAAGSGIMASGTNATFGRRPSGTLPSRSADTGRRSSAHTIPGYTANTPSYTSAGTNAGINMSKSPSVNIPISKPVTGNMATYDTGGVTMNRPNSGSRSSSSSNSDMDMQNILGRVSDVMLFPRRESENNE